MAFRPDGTRLAISDQSRGGKSLIYVLPSPAARRGKSRPPDRVTGTGGRPMARPWPSAANANGEFDIYTIPVAGGEEKRLTTAKGLDDGPDYTAGRQIHLLQFRADRHDADLAHAARWQPSGAGHLPMTSTTGFPIRRRMANGWCFFPMKKDVVGHPANQNVRLRLMPLAGGTDPGVGQLLWRPRHHQRALLVAGQPDESPT